MCPAHGVTGVSNAPDERQVSALSILSHYLHYTVALFIAEPLDFGSVLPQFQVSRRPSTYLLKSRRRTRNVSGSAVGHHCGAGPGFFPEKSRNNPFRSW